MSRVLGLQVCSWDSVGSSHLLPTVSTGAARLTPEGPSRDGPPRGLVRPAPGRRVRGTGWPWLPVHKRLRNRLPLPPVRRGHGDSRTVHPGGESVRRPSSVACGPPQPARPAPCTRAPRASHTRHRGVFRRLLRVNSYEWLRGHVEGVLKICPASLQAADPLCMSPGKMQVSRRLTARWGHRGRLGRKLRLNAAGERSNLCCSRTVRINVISR